ncbi:PLP-dependent transferase [Acuticoccus sp. MNP-M23]|uniref:trans-sulfuration enzyme family protein n=1 Tax=Acuticoccus sp. MNP-M23 TaxID=3072793 RepID=UPI002815C670|nr:PLP-dependent transferase [Acuticoccus sp. MNP-M23]WMS42686.1 PLP-dependent transferase [Acuticoccus sp. MNP-M23]
MKPPFRPATIAAQANGQINTATGGTVGPIETSTTFERDDAYRLPASGDIYRRDNNATVREAEAVLNALEGAAETRLFGSGLAAIAAVMRAAQGPIALQDGTYYGTQKLGEAYAAEGRTVVRFPAGDLDALRRVCAEAKPGLVVIETPSNPWLAVVDIAGTAEIAHEAGALLAIDSTAATPILTRPLDLGADIVMHSATKALNGHSDVLAGALCVREKSETWERILSLRAMEGAVLSSFDAYLLTRGMRTLAVRVAAMNHNAAHIAHWLEAHPAVTAVRWPGLSSHPAHALASRQMQGGFGSLMSFDVKGGASEALAVLSRLKLIKRATSLGGVETLIEHRHSIEPAFTNMPPALLRLSVGIEAVEDLVADLSEGLGAIA